MKSEAIETDRIKIESRQSIHRRKMSKNSSIVNGADESLSYVAEDESVVRKINLAAAFHDHISCTKSAELCKIDGTRETRVSLPCETDHIYANCSDMKNKSSVASAPNTPLSPKELSVENNRLRSVIYAQLDIIKRLEGEIEAKNNEILKHKQESNMLRSRLEHRERMCQIRKRTYKSGKESDISDTKNKGFAVNNLNSVVNASTSSNVFSSVSTATPSASTTSSNSTLTSPVTNEYSSNISSVNLVTRYFGRRSKTIPSRALKRRYLGPPKTLPSKKIEPKSLSSATSVSSESEIHEDEMIPKPEVSKDIKAICENTALIDIKKINKKRGKKSKGITRKMMDFLTTDKAYFLPDNQISTSSLVCSEILIDVPSWKLKPVTSFYQMEGTENINDSVFQRRHLKCEQDERRRKRWDIQRLREQKASEKLKYKYSRESGKDSENSVQQKYQSFYPDPRHIQYIEVTNQLPVLALGHLIPLFQPSEFSLSWNQEEKQHNEPTENHPVKMAKKARLSSTGPKVT